MDKNSKILIVSVLNHLQTRDPEWKHEVMQQKLKILYSGWVTKRIRERKHDKYYYSRKWREGWLPLEEYLSFYRYVMQ